jgi:hypothetical protein
LARIPFLQIALNALNIDEPNAVLHIFIYILLTKSHDSKGRETKHICCLEQKIHFDQKAYTHIAKALSGIQPL